MLSGVLGAPGEPEVQAALCAVQVLHELRGLLLRAVGAGGVIEGKAEILGFILADIPAHGAYRPDGCFVALEVPVPASMGAVIPVQ